MCRNSVLAMSEDPVKVPMDLTIPGTFKIVDKSQLILTAKNGE
jgi:hypothetical protein